MTTQSARDVLYTLLPRDVLERMEAPGGEALLGSSSNISACTVMFVHTSCLQNPNNMPVQHRSPIAEYAASCNASTIAGSADQGAASLTQFEAVHRMFCKWDKLVEDAGLYKYQHVNEWYIVACPRAAASYDTALQLQPYPHQYLSKMVKLADGILQVVSTSTFLLQRIFLQSPIG